MKRITVLFAVTNEQECREFGRISGEQGLALRLLLPADVKDVDRILKSDEVDIIVTDLQFQQGGFADRLFLWNSPFILMADFADAKKIDAIVKDESSAFLIRDPELRHLRILPILLRKVLNSRESINRQNSQFENSEQRYLDLVQAVPDMVYSLDSQGHFTFINNSVRSLGWQPVELIGRHFSALVHPEDVARVSKKEILPRFKGRTTGPAESPKLFDERRTGERMTRELEVRLRRKESEANGGMAVSVTAFGEVNSAGHDFLRPEQGDPGTVGIIRDISQRREAERLVRQALRDKTTLLKEIHHRIKNNLQVVASLLSLQSRYAKHPDDVQLFLESQMQVRSMAMMHEQLYNTDDMDSIAMGPYLRLLFERLYEVYRVSRNRIRIDLDVQDLVMEVNLAIPVALLINELVSNSFKYAFPGEAAGRIIVRMRESDADGYELILGDNGKGLPADLDISNAETLGHQLVHYLANQIGGSVERLDQPGANFRIAFKRRPAGGDQT